MSSSTVKTPEEEAIRSMIDTFTAAVRAKDVPKLMTLYARDVVLYGMAPPLREKGIEAMQRLSEGWLSSWEGPLEFESTDLRISAGSDVAFSHMLNHVRGKKRDGEAVDMWWRVTVGFQKSEGRWFVTHEHISEPFDMQTFKAALDLKP
jgi:uncharacterized protein (TIGR02246 family)